MDMKKLLSFVTAFVLVTALAALLPEGALKAAAADGIKQTISINLSNTDEKELIKFSESLNYSTKETRSYSLGDKVTLNAKEMTDHYYFERWAIKYGTTAEQTLSYDPTFTYTVSSEMYITAVYQRKYMVTFVENVPPADVPDATQTIKLTEYEYLMPGDILAQRGSLYFGSSYKNVPYVPTVWIDRSTNEPFDFSQPINSNKTLEMKYVEGEYKYRLITACSPADGGVAVKSSGSDYVFYKYGDVEIVDCDAETGYRFAYWIDDSPEKNQYINHMIRYAVKGNYTLTAVFKSTSTASSTYDVVIEHGAAYAVNGGTRKYDASAGAKLKIQANQGMNEGQVFDHWEVVSKNVILADPNASTTTFTMPADHVAIRAVYKTVYTVSFDANGGTGYMDEEYVDLGKQYTLPKCGFKAPAGKEFLGWDMGQPGEKIDVSGSITIKPIWGVKIKTVNVTLTEPKAGDPRINNATTSTNGVKVESRVYSRRRWVLTPNVVIWYSGANAFVGETYVKDNIYTAQIRLVADDGYEINKDTKVSANGKQAAFDSIDETGAYIFKISYDLRDRIPGDVNGDGAIDIKDVTVLKQYLAKWNVTINKSNADVTGDGDVTVKDLTLLKQHLAKWNVTLK